MESRNMCDCILKKVPRQTDRLIRQLISMFYDYVCKVLLGTRSIYISMKL